MNHIITVTHFIFVCSFLGSLVMEHPGEASTPFQGCVLFGTVNGTIGERLLVLPGDKQVFKLQAGSTVESRILENPRKKKEKLVREILGKG